MCACIATRLHHLEGLLSGRCCIQYMLCIFFTSLSFGISRYRKWVDVWVWGFLLCDPRKHSSQQVSPDLLHIHLDHLLCVQKLPVSLGFGY